MDGELVEEFPDIHLLFQIYNEIYFLGRLGPTSVHWSSKRMTMCAGVCEYTPAGGCRIKLSQPILQYRPISDLKNTLLHEMIHAYLFLSDGDRDREGHGPNFLAKMHEINRSRVDDPFRPSCGYALSVYHTFHAEVEIHQRHRWACRACGRVIRRAMDRPPSRKDCREYRVDARKMKPCQDPKCGWHSHEKECGGIYDKIQAPIKTHPPPATKVNQKQEPHNSKYLKDANGRRIYHSITSFFNQHKTDHLSKDEASLKRALAKRTAERKGNSIFSPSPRSSKQQKNEQQSEAQQHQKEDLGDELLDPSKTLIEQQQSQNIRPSLDGNHRSSPISPFFTTITKKGDRSEKDTSGCLLSAQEKRAMVAKRLDRFEIGSSIKNDGKKEPLRLDHRNQSRNDDRPTTSIGNHNDSGFGRGDGGVATILVDLSSGSPAKALTKLAPPLTIADGEEVIVLEVAGGERTPSFPSIGKSTSSVTPVMECPVCGKPFDETDNQALNVHLDACIES